MASLIGWRGMPHVYAFQFWATRFTGGQLPICSGPGNWYGKDNRCLAYITCVDNTADILWTKTVELEVGDASAEFEFVDVGDPPSPGNIAVEVASGATAAQVATALALKVDEWIGGVWDQALTGNGATHDLTNTARVIISFLEPAYANILTLEATPPAAPGFQVQNPNPRSYGRSVFQSAWKAFVCPGHPPVGYTPAIELEDPACYYMIPAGIIPVHGMPRWVQAQRLWPNALVGKAPG